MIDRKTYLEMCQRYAVLPNSVLGIKDNVPDELKVTHKGHQYYPKSYTIEFDKSGNIVHIVTLHSLIANSVINCELKDIELYKNQSLDKDG